MLPPPEEHYDDICQLAPNTPDGFSEQEVQVYYEAGPDPPIIAEVDPPHWGDISDPPHWED